MSKAQWTVAGLLLALLGLEVVRSPSVKGFFTGFYTNFQAALGQAATAPTTNAGSYSSTPHSINQPPPGICVSPSGNANVPCSSLNAGKGTTGTA